MDPHYHFSTVSPRNYFYLILIWFPNNTVVKKKLLPNYVNRQPFFCCFFVFALISSGNEESGINGGHTTQDFHILQTNCGLCLHTGENNIML